MKVKDIMTRRVIHIKPHKKVSEVARLLTKYKIHGLPVVVDDKILGIITESDFFTRNESHIYLPSYIDFLKKCKVNKTANHKEMTEYKKILKAKAEDIMSKDCVTINQEEGVKELIEKMRNKNLYTLPVVDDEKKMVGVVTQADIIKLL